MKKEVEKEDGKKKEGEVDDVVENQNSFKIGLTKVSIKLEKTHYRL